MGRIAQGAMTLYSAQLQSQFFTDPSSSEEMESAQFHVLLYVDGHRIFNQVYVLLLWYFAPSLSERCTTFLKNAAIPS